jgi:23S rRNA pseudoU1915 N3-methylase RlmH
MPLMPLIDEATPAKIRMVEVEKHKETTKVNIEQLTEVNKDSLEEYLLKPTKLITMAQDFIKCTTEELNQEVSTKV